MEREMEWTGMEGEPRTRSDDRQIEGEGEEQEPEPEQEQEQEQDQEQDEDDSASDLLRDRFRLSAISIAEFEAKKIGLEVSEPVVACIADLAFKYTEQLAKDLELFAHHAGRKTVNMEDVILSAHRNEHLATSLRSLRNDLKAKEPASDRKRKKGPKKDVKAAGVVHIPDLEEWF